MSYCVIIKDNIGSSSIGEIITRFSKFGGIQSIKTIEEFDLETYKSDTTTYIEYDNIKSMNEAKEFLDNWDIVINGYIISSPETYNDECPCSYGEKHGNRKYRSCHGERCRNDDHKINCTYYTCTACFSSSSF